jgi:hypothetical protein
MIDEYSSIVVRYSNLINDNYQVNNQIEVNSLLDHRIQDVIVVNLIKSKMKSNKPIKNKIPSAVIFNSIVCTGISVLQGLSP